MDMMKQFSLEGKVALITGAAYGIGFAIAEAYANCGAKIAFNCRGEKHMEEAMKAYAEKGIDAKGYYCDVTNEEDVVKMVADIERDLGTIDILVNNAGISQALPLNDYTDEEMDRILDINLKAVFVCSRAAARLMEASGGGVILNTSSVVSLYGQPSGCLYPTTKFAVNGLTKSLSRELAPRGIRVNAVAPGVTRTDMVANLSEALIKPLVARIPIGRVGEPDEVADAFLFLASDMASYITGAVLPVDGGVII